MRKLVFLLIITLAFAACSSPTGDDGNGIPSKPTEPSLPTLTGEVIIIGSAEVGQTLTANIDSLGGSGTISYQWRRITVNSGTVNIGTNINTYTVQSSDVGSTITVTVTCSGYIGSITSTPTAGIGLPILTGTVSISGTAEVGKTLTADTTNLDGNGTISYHWKRETINIGTNSNTYIVQPTDEGSTITVTVTRSSNSGSVTSDPTTIVIIPVLEGTIGIIGNTYVGQTLRADISGLNGIGAYSYVWKSGDTVGTVNTVITNTNQQTYTLTQTDVDKYIAVTITNSINPGNVISEAVGPIMAISPEINVPGVDLAAKFKWLKSNKQSNSAYLITVDKDESLSGVSSSDTSKDNYLGYMGYNNIVIRLMGTGGERTVRPSSNGSIFLVRGVTLILDNNITLQGHNNNNSSVISVDDGYVGGGSVLEMRTGAKIFGNTVSSSAPYPDNSSYGGGVTVKENGIFIMNGGEISGNTSKIGYGHGGGVYVYRQGIFTMNDGEISGNTATGNFGGGGVYVEGTFTMNEGKIYGNNASYRGGGVSTVDPSAFFTMNGGEISGNTAPKGGGINVEGSGISISGGKITGNISSGTSGGFGGGIYVNRGTLTMSGSAVISGNTSDNGSGSGGCSGGGILISDGTFIMSGGEISGNTTSASPVSGVSTAYGGGISISGTFIMSGGKISGNTASASGSPQSSGGGVYFSRGTFNMSGGEISGNTASSSSSSNNDQKAQGGGVFISGTFNMSGGEISGNTVSVSSSSFPSNSYGAKGGGVYVYSDPSQFSINSKGTFTKSGGGTITGYTSDTINGNVVKEKNIVQSNKGHAVYVREWTNSSEKEKGRRDNTAGPTDNMDSTVTGTAGGWEN
jgi:hypothetical protein